MKRYLLFAGDSYYPHGGWSDFKGSFDALEESKLEENCSRVSLNRDGSDSGERWKWSWGHIVDSEQDFKTVAWMSMPENNHTRNVQYWSEEPDSDKRYREIEKMTLEYRDKRLAERKK